MKSGRARVVLISVAVIALTILLFAWALRDVSLPDIAKVLSALRTWQIIVILLVNAGTIFLFVLRWWLILRAQGFFVNYFSLARYRLAAFAISYFTPGQHFGGEPLQVLLLRQHHKVPSSAAIASVALDKAMELFANFTVLAGGIAILLASGLFGSLPLKQALPFSIVLLLLPIAYLFGLWRGWRPLQVLTKRFKGRLAKVMAAAEGQLAELTSQKPALLLQCLVASALVWMALFFEFWLMLHYLGLTVDSLQLLVVVIAGRIALLAPTPGALGALEASQVLAMQTLGFEPAYGLGLGLLIRARDIFFGLVGLLLGGAEGLSAYRRMPR